MTGFASKQFVVDEDGNQIAVMLDLATHKTFLEATEELEDIRAYDEAKDRVREELRAGEFATLEGYAILRRPS